MEPRRSKHYLARIPTIALLVLFAMSPELSILFFILRAIDRDALKKEQENADYASDFRAEDTRADQSARPVGCDDETVYGHDIPTAEQKNAKKWHKNLTTLCTVFGAIFLVAGLAGLGDIIDLWGYWFDWGEFITALTQILGGGAALGMGLRMRNACKLERKLDKIVGDRSNIPLDELFAAAGIDSAKGIPVVERAIDHGYFGADAYIDHRTGTLIVRGAAPQPPQTEEESKAEPAPEDLYASLQAQLRKANEAIPDPVMTAKISRLEEVSARIFALAKKDPGKKAQLQKFMDYYLPTALKLLNTYAQLSAQDVQGENISEAKQSIERSMDLLITAFENQLDKLFQSDALDISADVAALEGMLNLDGLAASDFKPGNAS